MTLKEIKKLEQSIKEVMSLTNEQFNKLFAESFKEIKEIHRRKKYGVQKQTSVN